MAPVLLSVLLPYRFDAAFTYAAPEAPVPPPGTIVTVPLGRRTIHGVVWDEAADETIPPARLKPVGAIVATPPFPATLRRFIDWVAQYTMAPRGEVLALALKPNLLDPPPPILGWVPGTAGTGRITPARQRVLDALAGLDRPTTTALAAASGASPAVVRGLADAGFLLPAVREAAGAMIDPDHARPDLSPEQETAAATLRESVERREFEVTLLEGVTGAGKTEVFCEAIAETLRAGRQALVLVPEIALSAQFAARFAARFGTAPTLWHSGLTPSVRRANYHAVANGGARLVLGARSALFLPFADPGLIVVDEEHEAAYKQEDGVTYHARDMAVVRGRIAGCAVVLASATPSLESAVNAETGRYRHITLAARHGGAEMPTIEAIDLREAPPPRGRFLSPVLTEALADTLSAGGQAMLFLNRRGYAPLTLCRACGHRLTCPNCTAWLVEHRRPGHLLCHHCGHTAHVPAKCPECSAEESFVPIGPGVERIAEEAAELFPDARTILMASDAVTTAEQAEAALRAIVAHDVDLVIGTQMIAKGWHFPGLTLVGVVDADLGLGGGDLRAGERSAQLLHQVAGRAGRGRLPGRVMLQTFAPEHPVMRALIANDLAGFRRAEADLRAPGHWPPFGRLAALIVSADDTETADRAAAALARTQPHEKVQVLGPAPAPFAMLRGRHRRRLLLHAPRTLAVQPILRDWLARAREDGLPRAARVDIDIDPISFL